MEKKVKVIYEFDDEKDANNFFNRVHDLIVASYFGKISPTVEVKRVE